MKSIIFCEGSDDLWFIAYYLNKIAGWDTCNALDAGWKNYQITTKPSFRNQSVIYMKKDANGLAIWAVGGKDSFEQPITTINKFIQDFPLDPIDSITLVRDRDCDNEGDILKNFESILPGDITLTNRHISVWEDEIDGYPVRIQITPIIIPFDEAGAIETLLINSIREEGKVGEAIVKYAEQYINSLSSIPEVSTKYFPRTRLILKAKFSATIAATNPDHSTGQFQDMIMACPWEKSPYVKEHFDVILNAIS